MGTDTATREQTVLFGLLAVQSGKLNLEQWEAAARTVNLDAHDARTLDIGQQLVAAGTLSPHDAVTLQGMAAEALRANDGDALKAIHSVAEKAETVQTLASGLFTDPHEAATFVQSAGFDPTAATIPLDAGRPEPKTFATDSSYAETIDTGASGATGGDSSYAETIATDSSHADTIASNLGSNVSHADTVMSPNRPHGAAPTVLGAGMPGEKSKPRSGGDSLPAVPEHEGRYDFVKSLKSGGMGQIIVVHDTHLGRDVALKTLLPDRVPGGTRGRTRTGAPTMEILTVPIIARFLQEARIAGQLEHPGIAPAYELGYKPDGTIYYTMQMIHGKDLDDKLKECKTLADRMKWLPAFLDVCNAIAFAHSRGVVHRDLKPMNVMIGEFGETLTIDWGIAKIKGSKDIHEGDVAERTRAYRSTGTQSSTKTMEGQAMGSPFYMPPEQAAGRIELVDERADIYALGAILYMILAGKPPYKELKVMEFLDKVQRQPPRPIRDQEPEAPAELIAICERAMARKREDRYQTALELRDEVDKYIKGGLVAAYKYTFADLARRWVKKHWKILSTAAAGVAAIIILGIGSYFAIRAQRDAAITELYFADVSLAQRSIESQQIGPAKKQLEDAPAKHRNWEWGHFQQLINPDRMTLEIGGQYAGIAANGKIITANDRGTISIVNPLTGESEAQLIKTPGHGCAFAMSADARRVATNGPTGVFVWDIESKQQLFAQPHALQEGRVTFPFGISLSADGAKVAANEPDNIARVWDVASGQKLYEAPAENGAIFLDAAGGRAVVVNLDHDQATYITAIVDLATQTALKQYDFGADNSVKDAVFSPEGKHLAIATDQALIVFETETWTMPIPDPGDPERKAKPINGPFGKQDAVAFSADGKYLVAGTKGGDVFQVDLSTYTGFYAAVPHTGDVRSIAIASEAGLLATASGDRTAHLYDLASLDLIDTFRGHDASVFDVAIDPKGATLVTASFDATTKVWDLAANQKLALYPPVTDRAVAFAQDKGQMAFATPRGVVIADAATQRSLRLIAELKNANLLAWDPAATRLAIYQPGSGGTGTVSVRDTAAGDKILHEWKVVGAVTKLSIAGDGNTVVTSGDEGVQAVNIATAEVKPINGAATWAVAPRGDAIAYTTPNADGMNTHVSIATLPGLEIAGEFEVRGPANLLWGSDGSKLYAGTQVSVPGNQSPQGSLLRWDVTKKSKPLELTGHGQIPSAVADNAQYIVSGAGDASIIIWDAHSGRQLHTLKGHAGKIHCLAISPEGKRLSSGAGDGTFKLWSMEDGRLVATVHNTGQTEGDESSRGDTRWYTAFTPDGATLATISNPPLPPLALHAFPWDEVKLGGSEKDPLPVRIEQYKRGLVK